MSFFKKITLIVGIMVMSSNLFADTKKVTIDVSVSCESCQDKCEKCQNCIKSSNCYKSYELGNELCDGDLPKAYNAPAGINVSGINTFVTSSFIYWEILTDQTNLGIARFGNQASDEYEFEVKKFPTIYEPGFKVGLGVEFFSDNWNLFSQYTRLHKIKHTSFDLSGLYSFLTPWIMIGNHNISTAVGSIKAFKKFNLDKLDLELARSYYVGKNLTLKPFIGGEVHWLDQNYNIEYTVRVGGETPGDFFNMPNRLFLKNDSWALGPRFGLGSNWIFYKGFRLFASGALNLLYSKNNISGFGNGYFKELSQDPSAISYIVPKVKKSILRDVEELMIGLGWGSYFKCDKWYFDLFVAYDAQRYSHTNYMAQLAQIADIDNVSNSIGFGGHNSSNLVKPGDSFLHGLTITARLDF
ncbi:MAG: hypothetical protein KR126chlam6_01340 [Candidatus Anoxychlamydiales bacterium]|nr:hypothetical protein [Candidatus Anoxychlamydiales bacterium]